MPRRGKTDARFLSLHADGLIFRTLAFVLDAAELLIGVGQDDGE
ncbi:MAG TPA: hypothetical protein VEK07_12880 [Polyangiaceae bacterium]|nr:hypothetical protein [Polyangiaceae bacterium]